MISHIIRFTFLINQNNQKLLDSTIIFRENFNPAVSAAFTCLPKDKPDLQRYNTAARLMSCIPACRQADQANSALAGFRRHND
jgi:hypothetical protein